MLAHRPADCCAGEQVEDYGQVEPALAGRDVELAERFSYFALTDQRGGERLDRVAVAPGEIRLADRAHQIAPATLAAADWVILVTSLPSQRYPAADILALYRLRWRIELAFKRLKSLVGPKRPPGTDARSARAYVLAHLLVILLLPPPVDAIADSPRPATA